MRQGVLRASNRPSGGWGPATGNTNRGDPLGSWSLDGLSVEVVTSETGALEEVLGRRMRRTHCGWPNDNPAGAECYLSILPFDSRASSTVGPRGLKLSIDRVGEIRFVRKGHVVLVVRPVMRLSGIGARCIRTLSFVSGISPTKGF